MPSLKVTFRNQLVLNICNMNSQIHTFISQWNEKFPGVDAPNTNFADVEDIERSLSTCKSAIRNLEETLNREKFYLIFLQTYLAAKKKTYTSGRWGFDHATTSSSVEAEKSQNSINLDNKTDNYLSCDVENDSEKEIANESTSKERQSSVKNEVGIAFRPSNQNRTNSNRSSKVLANVKLFEAKADIKEQTLGGGVVPDEGAKPIVPHKASTRKRTSYLEVWECKSGAEDEQKVQKEEKSGTETSETAAIAMAFRIKPTVPQRGSRKDYVEVWRCNTGDQVSIGLVYDDDQSNFNLQSLGNEGDIDDSQDYDVEDIDMKDGYGKKHYTVAGSDIKLRQMQALNGDPSSTWPAAVIPFQDNALQGAGSNIDGFSSNIDLSDLDDNDDTSESSHSDSDLDDSGEAHLELENPSLTSGFDISPLNRLTRAQTTNERMSVAFGALTSCWSDDERELTNRSSVLSANSVDIHSSDDDERELEDYIPTPTPSANSEQTDGTDRFMFPSPKDNGANNLSRNSSFLESNKFKLPSSDDTKNRPQREVVSDLVDYQKVRSIAEAEKLRMRKWVLSSLLDTEEAYLQYLNTLLLYMKPLRATIGTSQPVMSAQDFDTLFFRVPELHNLHANFYNSLKPRLDKWSADTNVGDLFKTLLDKLNLYSDYLNNYKRAQHTVEKCAKENAQFAKIIESLKVQSRGSKDTESISLIDVLYKPVERVMRTTLVLQDLLKRTPHRHPDYQVLRQVLKQSQIFLERINSASSSFKPRKVPSSQVAAARSADRELIKDGFLVEIAGDGSRKLRHCFLFSDLLLCAKQKNTAGMFHSKDTYECKWYIPLADLSFQPKEDSEVIPEAPPTEEEILHRMSNNAQQLKLEISRERKRSAKLQKTNETTAAKSKKEERLRKKLVELEARIVLAAPDLPLRIYHMQGKNQEETKSYMFLMSSDYERIEWTEAIMKQQESCFKSFSLTTFEVNLLLAACVKHRKVNNIGSMLMREDDELLSGYLNVTIHSGQGFLRACNPYCTLEVDSYGQFQTKAKTRPCRDTKAPVWDEEFELDVDGAMTLRILCYDRAREASAGASYDDDVLIAKGKVGLIQESLREKGEWVEESVLMNEITIRVSVKFIARERSLQRTIMEKSTGVFGVNITKAAKRSISGIPSVVTKCVNEVERRGMNEVGIYRVSGVASGIQELKASFDADRKDVNVLIGEVDINAVAGALKLYFRELPEPLFTSARYKDFLEASSLTDPETKQRTIARLLSELPAANYKTLHFLRNHLIKVAKNEQVNKMSLHNLATVFGPTLLRPAEDEGTDAVQTSSQKAMIFNALQLDVHYQMDVLLYCLEMKEMLDYDNLKSNAKKKEKPEHERSFSQSFSSISLDQTDDKNSDDVQKKRRPIMRSSTTEPMSRPTLKTIKDASSNQVAPHPRYHPYEEVYIPPKINSKPQIQKPPVARKPSAEPNGRGNGPTPIPRRSLPPKQPVVTDI